MRVGNGVTGLLLTFVLLLGLHVAVRAQPAPVRTPPWLESSDSAQEQDRRGSIRLFDGDVRTTPTVRVEARGFPYPVAADGMVGEASSPQKLVVPALAALDGWPDVILAIDLNEFDKELLLGDGALVELLPLGAERREAMQGLIESLDGGSLAAGWSLPRDSRGRVYLEGVGKPTQFALFSDTPLDFTQVLKAYEADQAVEFPPGFDFHASESYPCIAISHDRQRLYSAEEPWRIVAMITSEAELPEAIGLPNDRDIQPSVYFRVVYGAGAFLEQQQYMQVRNYFLGPAYSAEGRREIGKALAGGLDAKGYEFFAGEANGEWLLGLTLNGGSLPGAVDITARLIELRMKFRYMAPETLVQGELPAEFVPLAQSANVWQDQQRCVLTIVLATERLGRFRELIRSLQSRREDSPQRRRGTQGRELYRQ